MENLDLNNCGVHFTANKDYNHVGGGSNGLTKTSGKIRVCINVLGGYSKKINSEATAISNANYPSENEVVLDFNQKLTAWINGQKVMINTGTRADIWVINL
ncbi:MAG: hypothetical protein IM602_17370 [Cytophagales bacterium]|nr:hypothetical protein [Cytophagales bacterium]MCA6415668.1 hypothetical protein [Cytophagales bacterium]MCA6427417.1 hypothetical protein [Cytophagales bacterium]